MKSVHTMDLVYSNTLRNHPYMSKTCTNCPKRGPNTSLKYLGPPPGHHHLANKIFEIDAQGQKYHYGKVAIFFAK